MVCLKPVRLKVGITVGCGSCLACRIRKRTEWSIRMLHELESHEDAIFITLTYNDDNIQYNKNQKHIVRLNTGQYIYPTLRKKDIQLFIKRLRKLTGQKKIKYFICGEYGELHRPHYHGIIFGLSLKDEDKEKIKLAWPKCDWNQREIAEKSFGLAEPDSILYVSKYINKKFNHKKGKEEYHEKNREPVFRLLSLGLGKEFAEKNLKQIISQGFVSLNGIKHSIPRYYLKRMESLGVAELPVLKAKLKERAEIEEADKVGQVTGLYCPENVMHRALNNAAVVEYKAKKKATAIQTDRNIQANLNLKASKL